MHSRPINHAYWWTNRDTSRTLAIHLNHTTQHAIQTLTTTRLLKTNPTMTGLELAQHYAHIQHQHNLHTVKALARHLNQPYQTIKNTLRLNQLSNEAKKALHTAAKNPHHRQRITTHALRTIHTRATTTQQLQQITQILNTKH